MLFPCVILERSEESRLPEACAEKSVGKKRGLKLNAEAQKRIGILLRSGMTRRLPQQGGWRGRSEEKKKNRFAEILRLQQLPLRMTQKRRRDEKRPGFFASP